MKPNTAIDVNAKSELSDGKSPASGLSESICVHCASPLGSTQVASGHIRFCCHGCQSVYELLNDKGYGHYYQLLAGSGKHASRARDDESFPDAFDPLLWAGGGDGRVYDLYIPAMTCAACIWLLENAVAQESGVASVRVNLEQRSLLVGILPERDHKDVLRVVIKTLRRYGYAPMPYSARRQEEASQLRRPMIDVGVAAAAFGNVMLFSTSIYFGDVWGIEPSIAAFFNWWSAFIATASLLWPGRVFFQHSWLAVKTRRLHIDLPIALALLVAWLTSVHSLLFGGTLFYWDSITGLIFLLLTGRYLNNQIANRARHLASASDSLLPPESAHCQPGDRVVVAVGQNFPADGQILEGTTTVDESALTGESRAAVKSQGDRVLGGSRNLSGTVQLLVENAGEQTWIRQFEQTISQAAAARDRMTLLADRILPWFTLATLILTLAAGFYWWPSGPAKAVEVMCVVLIVSCPCALALATPLCMAIALKRAWRHGAIIKGADILEALAAVDTVVLDKTGTLTKGDLSVRTCHQSIDGHMSFDPIHAIHAVASQSLHPVARGVSRWIEAQGWSHVGSDLGAMHVQEYAGFGLIGRSKLAAVVIGRESWVRDQMAACAWDDSGLSADRSDDHVGTNCVAAVVALDGVVPKVVGLMTFSLSDDLHDDAPQTLARLRTSYDVWLLTGDRVAAALAVAAKVNLPADKVVAEATPESKLACLQRELQRGRRVLMVGDGVNDGAALAAATVGVAVKGGVDVALNSAGVYLTRPGLAVIADLLEFARYTRRSLRSIMALSISYNMAAVTLAFAGVLHPGIAALIMPVSSLTVLAIVNVRKGNRLWKSSSSWCPLPSLSPGSRSSVLSGP